MASVRRKTFALVLPVVALGFAVSAGLSVRQVTQAQTTSLAAMSSGFHSGRPHDPATAGGRRGPADARHPRRLRVLQLRPGPGPGRGLARETGNVWGRPLLHPLSAHRAELDHPGVLPRQGHRTVRQLSLAGAAHLQNAIATAVEEQSVTTGQVGSSILGVAVAAADIETGIRANRDLIQVLEVMSNDLRSAVSRFLIHPDGQ